MQFCRPSSVPLRFNRLVNRFIQADLIITDLANFREARLNEALAADAFACSVSAVCL